ncbi:MAG: HdeD family acid-resistance protein [Gemmatirosa sp.]
MRDIARSLARGDPDARLGAASLLVVARQSGWHASAIRGIVAVVLGACALAWPEESAVILIALLTGYAALTGGSTLIVAVQLARAGLRAWPLALYAAVALMTAATLAFWPSPAALAMATLFAAWMVVAGTAELALAWRLRGVLPHLWPLAVTGLVSLAFAWVLIADPAWAVPVALRLFGIYALVTGAFLLGMAFRLRRWSAYTTVVLRA